MTPENVFEWGAALATLGIGVCTVALALGGLMFSSGTIMISIVGVF